MEAVAKHMETEEQSEHLEEDELEEFAKDRRPYADWKESEEDERDLQEWEEDLDEVLVEDEVTAKLRAALQVPGSEAA